MQNKTIISFKVKIYNIFEIIKFHIFEAPKQSENVRQTSESKKE